MKGKIRGVLICLAFAVTTGAIALLAAWEMASSLLQAWDARDWVQVEGQVVSVERRIRKGSTTGVDGLYRYSYMGQNYRASRLGTITGDFNIGGWQAEMATRLELARDTKQPIAVYVNPAAPREAIVDRTIRLPVMAFLAVGMLLMGGLALGAARIGWRFVFGPAPLSAKALARHEASTRKAREPSSGLGWLWLLALVWNVVAIPIAMLALPGSTSGGNWLGYLILLIPLPGVLLLWAAITSTWDALRKRITGVSPAPPVAAASAPPAPRFVTDAPHYDFSPREAAPATNVPIPPDIATVQDLGGRITIRYEGDAAAALFGSLTVIAGDGQLRVVRGAPFGLFKRKDFVAPQSAIMTLGATHSNTDTLANPVVRYYSIWAGTTDNPHITIGRRLPGEAVANALLMRIAKVLKFSADQVWIARAPSP